MMNKRIFLLRLIAAAMFCLAYACDRRDLNDLYRMAAENEAMVKKLEESAKDMTEEIRSLHHLTQALMERLYITSPIAKTSEGYTFVFGNETTQDSIRVSLRHRVTPLVEIDPVTLTWHIDGKDTGVPAAGKDGEIPDSPQVRITADGYWEYSADGKDWERTTVKALGSDGDNGSTPAVGINEAGNWTLGGVEILPPVKAWGKEGTAGETPMIGIDKSVAPYEWTLSTDGGKNWTRTGVVAQAEDGEPGEPAPGNPYIKQISVVGDVITFTFSANIPGTNTNVQKVTIKRLSVPLTLTVNKNDLEYFHNTYWLLFGVNESRTFRYSLTGTATHVQMMNLPNFLKATVDMATRRVTVTSSGETDEGLNSRNFIQIMAMNAEGEYVLEAINVNRIFKLNISYPSDVYYWEAFAAGGNKVTEWFRYGDAAENVSLPAGECYYFGYPKASGFNPYWERNPHSAEPYSTIVRPVKVKDIDGNIYRVCTTGAISWMVENLKTTRYNDGTPIPDLSDTGAWSIATRGAWCYYDNDKYQADKYGLLYNGLALKSGKLCPKGWHISTNEDWLKIEKWLESNAASQFENNTGWRGAVAGERMKWYTGWTGYSRPPASFQSVFEFYPGGLRDQAGIFSGMGTKGFWWSPGQQAGFYFYRGLASEKDGVYRNNDYTDQTGMSVRCVMDDE